MRNTLRNVAYYRMSSERGRYFSEGAQNVIIMPMAKMPLFERLRRAIVTIHASRLCSPHYLLLGGLRRRRRDFLRHATVRYATRARHSPR